MQAVRCVTYTALQYYDHLDISSQILVTFSDEIWRSTCEGDVSRYLNGLEASCVVCDVATNLRAVDPSRPFFPSLRTIPHPFVSTSVPASHPIFSIFLSTMAEGVAQAQLQRVPYGDNGIQSVHHRSDATDPPTEEPSTPEKPRDLDYEEKAREIADEDMNRQRKQVSSTVSLRQKRMTTPGHLT